MTPLGDETHLDVVALVYSLGAVPEANAAAEQDRHLHDVQHVDEIGGEEVANDRRATADAHVEVAGCLRARSSASCGLASTKWNTVPPSISIDGRG